MCNDVTQAVAAIRRLESSDQINEVIEAIRLQQTWVAKNAARSIRVGTVVTFEGRRGRTVTGEVLKVNQKTIVVQDQSTQAKWKVTASMVSPV